MAWMESVMTLLRTAVIVVTLALSLTACRASEGIPAAPVELSMVDEGGEPIESGWNVEWNPKPETMGDALRVRSRMRWSRVPEGDYEITVTAPGYQSATLNITVVEDQPVAEDVILNPAG